MFLIPTTQDDLNTISPSIRAILVPDDMTVPEKQIHNSVKVIVSLGNMDGVLVIHQAPSSVALFSPKSSGYGGRIRTYKREAKESDAQLLKRLYDVVIAEEQKEIKPTIKPLITTAYIKQALKQSTPNLLDNTNQLALKIKENIDKAITNKSFTKAYAKSYSTSDKPVDIEIIAVLLPGLEIGLFGGTGVTVKIPKDME